MSGSVFSKFVVPSPRPFPVILVVDTSGSMDEEGKVEALNLAIREMISAFARENALRALLQVAVITFGGDGARLLVPFTPARGLTWTDVEADGATPMGAAIALLRELLEDTTRLPERAYRPAVVLLSDGAPTDEAHFRREVEAMNASERARKASRFVVAVGEEADEELLRTFLKHDDAPIFRPESAREIVDSLQTITDSLVSSSRTATPGEALSTIIMGNG